MLAIRNGALGISCKVTTFFSYIIAFPLQNNLFSSANSVGFLSKFSWFVSENKLFSSAKQVVLLLREAVVPYEKHCS
jgi:hypothetical protein